jgi:hypothetical protein
MAFAPSSEGLFAMDQTLNDFAINRLEDAHFANISRGERKLDRRAVSVLLGTVGSSW